MRGLKLKKLKTTFIKGKEGTLDYYLLCTIIALLAIGVVMVYSASAYRSMVENGNSMEIFIKQSVFAVIGIIAMLVISNIDYKVWKRFSAAALIVSAILLGLILLVEVGVLPESLAPDVNGARRWIKLGIQFQPSEIAKYSIVLFLAKTLAVKGDKIKNIRTLIGVLIIPGAIAGLVLSGKSMSITMVILLTVFIMLIIAGMKVLHIVLFTGLGAAFVALAIKLEPYRMLRFTSFTNPWADPKKSGYQLIQSFYSLGAGGITGLGLGKSRQKTIYMPEPHNDFIFAIIGEELGLIGCVVIMSLFIFFIYRGMVIAFGARETYGMLLAVGITTIIAVQAIINIAVVTGSMPTTGVPLPFISYGGTSLVINLAAMGVLLNISKSSKKSLANI